MLWLGPGVLLIHPPANAMAASCFPSLSTLPKTVTRSTSIPTSFKPSFFCSTLRFYSLSCFLTSHDSCAFRSGCSSSARFSRVLAVVQEKTVSTLEGLEESTVEDSEEEPKVGSRPCELYVSNLPRSCDISQLLELFKPYGTIQSVEVSRNIETGKSRGCGYVTMISIAEAKAAIAALDGSELGEREVSVRFSADVVSRRRNLQALSAEPKKNMVFESPYKAYVGNLAWSVKPENLREHFSQFGNVVSTRVLFDRKEGRHRVYAFLSFSSAEELEAAITANGVEFHGRNLLVREVIKKSEP